MSVYAQADVCVHRTYFSATAAFVVWFAGAAAPQRLRVSGDAPLVQHMYAWCIVRLGTNDGSPDVLRATSRSV